MNTDTPPGARRRATVLNLLGDAITPARAFHALAAGQSTALLFESSEHDSKLARFSVIAVDPVELIRIKSGTATIVRGDSPTVHYRDAENPFALLQERHDFNTRDLSTEGISSVLPFKSGLAGYIGYGVVGSAFDVPLPANDPLDVPDCMMGFFDSCVVFDHLLRSIHVVSFRSAQHAQSLADSILQPSSLRPLSPRRANEDCFAAVEPAITRDAFLEMVRRSKELIVEGQVFQIVVSQRFSTVVTVDELDVYRMLQSVNPSPYAYFLKFPELCYLGSSPETLVACRAGSASLRALAGTRPRHADGALDDEAAIELAQNVKELAEHYMLVDLGRNDLGRVAKSGTVTLGKLASIVRYAHVMHMATKISAKLEEGVSAFDLIASCFPAGTVSGAPKIRAMQLLAELEPEQRGIYSGMVGYVDLTGDTNGAIAIRSALIKDGQAHVNAGAGIVYDSVPESEYDETRNKAASVLRAISLAHSAEGVICR
ncbi:MAG: anthranilate synthase component I family protein [Candidatus Obscuribacterales bacterium]|nr:anthranilate synthase component I family protein [Candidatus Obscuribacterales bacterium]